jgi:hypothetical protein
MKPKEFYKIMEMFVKEDKFWRELKVGDTVYEERCDGMEFGYCKMEILEIDLEERLITVRDTSLPIPTTKKTGDFLTEKEFMLKKYRALNDN